jgi:hypothetical protein
MEAGEYWDVKERHGTTGANSLGYISAPRRRQHLVSALQWASRTNFRIFRHTVSSQLIETVPPFFITHSFQYKRNYYFTKLKSQIPPAKLVP